MNFQSNTAVFATMFDSQDRCFLDFGCEKLEKNQVAQNFGRRKFFINHSKFEMCIFYLDKCGIIFRDCTYFLLFR